MTINGAAAPKLSEILPRQSKPSRRPTPAIAAIERRRKSLDVSIEKLAAQADLSVRTYQRALAGQEPHAATLDKLDQALDNAAPRRPPGAIASLHRGAMALIAGELGLDVDCVLATDFSKQRPMDKAWLAAAKVRRQAIAVLVLDLGVGQAQLARAMDVSKQNVGQAVRQVFELTEEDGDVEARLARIGKRLGG